MEVISDELKAQRGPGPPDGRAVPSGNPGDPPPAEATLLAEGDEEIRARLAAIVESSDDAIISKTLQGTIRTWNTGAERIFGYTAQEAIGQQITMLIPHERLDEERQILARLTAGQRIEHYETVRLAKGGRELDVSLAVRRVPQLWFPVGATCFASNGMPCFSVHLPYGHFYGVPSVDGKSMKVCGGGERETVVDPSRLDRELHARDLLPIRRFIGDCLPGVLSSDPSAFDMCMCTMTPDESFIVDRHPLSNRVVFAAGFSGHGFKLAPSMGELLASLATQPDASSPAFLALRETVTQNGVGRTLPPPRTTTSSATIR
jgi:PAS domain S-box-containing protein